MIDTFRLGRVAGIPVGVNWTWLLVFVFFSFTLASSVFPASNPGLSAGTYVAMGVAAVLLFFASLFLHELGHALQARREGMRIEGITLWLLGGVARFRGDFPSAGAEFRIAIAGPIVTALLGAAFLGLAVLTHFAPALDGVLAWLGYINFVLLAFNLLPALPLDGGRVFRAALWQLRGDYPSATRVAAGVGRVVALAMIAAGIFASLTSGVLSGVWLAVVGWFVLGAARAEGQIASLRQALDGLVVGDLMRIDPPAAEAGETLRDFMAQLFWGPRLPAYPVLDDGRPVGLLTRRRVLQVPSEEWPAVRVRARMLPQSRSTTLRADEPAFDATLALATSGELGALVLGEDGQLAGIVLLSDLDDVLEPRLPRRPRWVPRPHAPR